MSEILSIVELKKMAHPIIQIPNFDNTGIIKVRVQRPNLMSMAAQGKIPNHLMGIVMSRITGKPATKKKEHTPEELIQDINKTMELYCVACLVEPSYEEFKSIITDDQKAAIFNWGLGEVKQLDSFRTDKRNGSSNNNGEEVSEKAE